MAKFRKKPVIVEAEQFHAGDAKWPAGVERTLDEFGLPVDGVPFRVKTAGGYAGAFDGDWIIAEPDGRGFYPCRPDIFDATYEPVGDQ